MLNEIEYLLTVISEECAEIAQVSSKAIRFGLDSTNRGKNLDDNKRLLERELADLIATARRLGLQIREEDIAIKNERLDKYMAYSREIGKLEVKP